MVLARQRNRALLRHRHGVAEIARRLERDPNFTLGTSARLCGLVAQGSAKVRQFCLDYQDRIQSGTDYVNMEDQHEISPECARKSHAHFSPITGQWWSSGTVKIDALRGQGVGLAVGRVDKIYFINAQRWYPGL